MSASVHRPLDMTVAKQQLRDSIINRLADRVWRRPDNFYRLVDDKWAEAVNALSSPMVYCDLPDPLDYGRCKLIDEAVQRLIQQGKCEGRERNGCQEVRLAPGFQPPPPTIHRDDDDILFDAVSALLPSMQGQVTGSTAKEDPVSPTTSIERPTDPTSAPAQTPAAEPTADAEPVEVARQGVIAGPTAEAEPPNPFTLIEQPAEAANHPPALAEPRPTEPSEEAEHAEFAPKNEEHEEAAVPSSDSKLPEKFQLGGYEFVIDPQFSALLDGHSDEEARQFDDNLNNDRRVLDPIIRWKGKNIVLDGHNRLRKLRRKPTMPFRVEDIELASREEALQWIVNHQAGQRNATPERLSHLRGQVYNAIKRTHGGERRPVAEARPHHENLKTAAKVAVQFGVSPSTINRDAKFADQVDTLVKTCGPEVKPLILAKNAPLDRKQVASLADLSPEEQPEAVKKAVAASKTGTPPNRKEKGAPRENCVPASQPSPSKTELRLCLSDTPKRLAQALIEGLGKSKAAKLRDALDKALLVP